MNSEDFIAVIKHIVRDAAIEDTIDNLEQPPGRKVSDKDKELSDWFNSLSTDDKDMVNHVIAKSIDHSLFGLFCVIDGVRAIENGNNKGKLKLIYDSKEQVVLNDGDKIGLHELYKSED